MCLKDKILISLIESRSFLSGEKLAEKFHVSRAAIWKTINILREEGHDIIAVNKKGYYINKIGDVLNKQQIRSFLQLKWKTLPICIYQTLDSTNSQAKREVAAGKEGTKLIISEEQSAGRGRRGRVFYSPKDKGIYMSLVIQPKLSIKKSTLITSAVAVAVCRALQKYTKNRFGIKWVNDIYLNGKKVCGILTEAISDFESGVVQNVIIGIGINLRSQQFPQELVQAGAIGIQNISRNEIIGNVTNSVLQIIEDLEDEEVLNEYRNRSIVIGHEINFEQNNIIQQARAIDIDENGGLVVLLQNGNPFVLNSGEITVRVVKKESQG